MNGNHWPTFPPSLQRQRIGVMHCSWGATSFAEHCRLAADLGAGYIEDFGGDLDERIISEADARAALDDAGLPLLLLIAPDLDCNDPAASADRVARAVERWQRIGLSTFVTLRSKRGPPLPDFLRCLERAAEAVRRAGLTPVTQNHRGGVVESPEELAACIATGVGLHYDTQQWPMAGHDALAAWDLVAPQVRHVHLGDRDEEIRGCPFGSGTTRMRALLQRMHASGYRGAMSIETEYGPDDAGAAPIVADAMAFVRSVLEPLDAVGVGEPAGHAQIRGDALPCVEADWGRLHWIGNGAVFAGCAATLGLVTIHPGRGNGLHRHPEDQELLYVQRGRCRHVCGERELTLEAGDVLFIPAGQAHGAHNIGDEPLELVVSYPTGCRTFEDLSHHPAEKVSA